MNNQMIEPNIQSFLGLTHFDLHDFQFTCLIFLYLPFILCRLSFELLPIPYAQLD